MMSRAFSVTATALTLLLPPLVWSLGVSSPWIPALLIATGLLHLAGSSRPFVRLLGILAVATGGLISVGAHQLAIYYPVLINAALLLVWLYSLVFPPTIIERIARAHGTVDAAKARYLRRLTAAWCGVFALNGSIALATTRFEDLTAWVLWNGLGAYLLVGSFALGEYLFRRIVHPVDKPETIA